MSERLPNYGQDWWNRPPSRVIDFQRRLGVELSVRSLLTEVVKTLRNMSDPRKQLNCLVVGLGLNGIVNLQRELQTSLNQPISGLEQQITAGGLIPTQAPSSPTSVEDPDECVDPDLVCIFIRQPPSERRLRISEKGGEVSRSLIEELCSQLFPEDSQNCRQVLGEHNSQGGLNIDVIPCEESGWSNFNCVRLSPEGVVEPQKIISAIDKIYYEKHRPEGRNIEIVCLLGSLVAVLIYAAGKRISGVVREVINIQRIVVNDQIRGAEAKNRVIEQKQKKVTSVSRGVTDMGSRGVTDMRVETREKYPLQELLKFVDEKIVEYLSGLSRREAYGELEKMKDSLSKDHIARLTKMYEKSIRSKVHKK